MKTKTLALTGLAALLLFWSFRAARSDTTNQPDLKTTRQLLGLRPAPAGEADSETALKRDANEKLFYGQLVADVAMHSAILRRLDQGDVDTAKGVLLTEIKGGLQMLHLQTNYEFSSEEKKAIKIAEDYLNQHAKQK